MKGSLAQAVNYCTKHDPEPLLDGIDLKAMMHAHTSKKKEVCPDIIAGKTTVAKFVQENPEHLFQFQSMDRSVKSFKLATAEAVTTIGSRGMWIWGPPNTGKTHYARRISLKQYGQNPFEKSTNKWWDGYENEKVVVMNDVDPSHALQHSFIKNMKIWTDRYPCSGEYKGGTMPLNHEIFIVTSNHSLAEVFAQGDGPYVDYEAILSRFKVIHMTKERPKKRQFNPIVEHIFDQFNSQATYNPFNPDEASADGRSRDAALGIEKS